VVAVGGAEAKTRRRDVLGHVVARAGGAQARIVVITTASSLGPEIGEAYRQVFQRLGVRSVAVVRPTTRAQAHDAETVDLLDAATGVFMSGGNQLKLSGVVAGTPTGDAIVAAAHRGAVVAGTSAGASILARHMIAFGAGGATPKQRMGTLAQGLGLVPDAIIDQHFEQRNRYGRLLALTAQNPALLGMGIDEDTAAVIEPDGRLGVVGRGAVTLVDASAATTTAAQARQHAPILVSGAVLHVLPAGATFDLRTRTLLGVGPAAPPGPATTMPVPSGSSEAEPPAPVVRRIDLEGADPHAAERADRRVGQAAAGEAVQMLEGG